MSNYICNWYIYIYIITVLKIDCIWDSGKVVIGCEIDNSKNRKKKSIGKKTQNGYLAIWRMTLGHSEEVV